MGNTFEDHRRMYPLHYPIIIHTKNKQLKLIIPLNYTVSQLIFLARKKIDCKDANKALFLISEHGVMYKGSSIIETLSNDFENKPITLHMREENTFG